MGCSLTVEPHTQHLHASTLQPLEQGSLLSIFQTSCIVQVGSRERLRGKGRAERRKAEERSGKQGRELHDGR